MEGKSRVLEDKNGDSFLVITHNKETEEATGLDYNNMDIIRRHQSTGGPLTLEEINALVCEDLDSDVDLERKIFNDHCLGNYY